MNPSQPNSNAGASDKEDEAARLTNSGETHDPPTDLSFQSSIPSAPLLPSSPYNPGVTSLDPPSYESVVGQDTGDSNNRFGSSSTGNPHQAYNQAPYLTGPGSAPHLAYPTGPQVVGDPPYPTAPIPMSMSMPGPVDTGSQIVFAAPVSVTSNRSYLVGLRYPAGHGQTPSHDFLGNRRKVRVTFAVLVLTFATFVLMVVMYR